MSPEQISRREDLRQLAEDGYEVRVQAGHVIVERVPYVTGERTVKYGRLVCPLSADGPPPAGANRAAAWYRQAKENEVRRDGRREVGVR